MTNNNNGEIVEVVTLENKILNSDDNVVGVENGRETDQLNENKDDNVCLLYTSESSTQDVVAGGE